VAHAGFMNYLARKYDETISVCKKALEIDPAFPGSYSFLTFAYQAKGELAEAIEWAEKGSRFSPNFLVRGWIYGLAGRKDEASQMLSGLKELSRRQYVSPWHFVAVYTGTGDVEAWRQAVRDSYDERANGLVHLKVLPLLDPWRSDPVYQEFVRKLGLP